MALSGASRRKQTPAAKGIVSNRYEPYQTLLDTMKESNIRTFGIIRHFDQDIPLR